MAISGKRKCGLRFFFMLTQVPHISHNSPTPVLNQGRPAVIVSMPTAPQAWWQSRGWLQSVTDPKGCSWADSYTEATAFKLHRNRWGTWAASGPEKNICKNRSRQKILGHWISLPNLEGCLNYSFPGCVCLNTTACGLARWVFSESFPPLESDLCQGWMSFSGGSAPHLSTSVHPCEPWASASSFCRTWVVHVLRVLSTFCFIIDY